MPSKSWSRCICETLPLITEQTQNHLETGNYKEIRLEESQVINLIIEKTKCKYGNLDFFSDVTNIPRTDNLNFDRYYIAREILRTDLGFENDKKPGDFDVIIIPAFKEKIFFQYTSAFEVKVVRPTNKNYRRNSNSLGTTQTFGIIEDGFPLVGLMQVCMNEPVTPKHFQYLPNLDNVSEIITFDPFPIYSIETQYERILKTELPKYVGINVFGLSFNQEEKLVMQDSSKFLNFKRGHFNPNFKESTVEKVKAHFENRPNEYVVKINNQNN
jgi:hypothetical protein